MLKCSSDHPVTEGHVPARELSSSWPVDRPATEALSISMDWRLGPSPNPGGIRAGAAADCTKVRWTCAARSSSAGGQPQICGLWCTSPGYGLVQFCFCLWTPSAHIYSPPRIGIQGHEDNTAPGRPAMQEHRSSPCRARQAPPSPVRSDPLPPPRSFPGQKTRWAGLPGWLSLPHGAAWWH